MVAIDLDDMAGLLGDRNAMQFYPAPKTRGEAQTWIEWNERNHRNYGYGLWIIETHAGNFVGDCGLTWQLVNGVQELEVGYHVRADVQGKGYATEAAAASRDFARDHTAAEDLVAIIHPKNTASRRVVEKIGMHQSDDDRARASLHRTVMRMDLRILIKDVLTRE